jgi:hypothetical protein
MAFASERRRVVAGCASSSFAGGPAAARTALRAVLYGTAEAVPLQNGEVFRGL